jgi:hypothetical protein
MPADRISQFITVPRARFWTIGPDGHAVKVSLSPGHSLRWSHPRQDGGPITKIWRHYLDYVSQEVVQHGYYLTQHVAALDGCTAHAQPLAHVPTWQLLFSGDDHD